MTSKTTAAYAQLRHAACCLGVALAIASIVASTCAAAVQFKPLALAGSFDLPGNVKATDLFVSGSYAYLVTTNNPGGTPPRPELYIIDVSAPQTPTLAGTLNLEGPATRIYVSGDYAYVAMNRRVQPLVIVDVHDRTRPSIAGSFDPGTRRIGLSLFASGTTVYFGTANNGRAGGAELYVINASDPAQPAVLGTYDSGGAALDLKLSGTTAYVASGNNTKELQVLDVSNPAAISEKGSFNAPGPDDANGLDYADGRIYLLRRGAQRSFSIIDVSSPIPALVGAASIAGAGRRVQVYRDRAYVSRRRLSQGLTVVDLSEPTQPKVLQPGNVVAASNSIFVNRPYAFVATGDAHKELQVFDLLLRPNIVVILTDDQRWDSLQYMPQIEAIAASRGVSFSNAFATTSLCTPSRASILSGQYMRHHGVLANGPPQGGSIAFGPKESATIAVALRDAGYRTGLYGKYMNSYYFQCDATGCTIPPGWDEWHAFVEAKYFNYQLNNNGPLVAYAATPPEYSTDVLAQMAAHFIESADRRPFFLYFNPKAPHAEAGSPLLPLPPVPAPRHAGLFATLSPFTAPSYDEADISDKPGWLAGLPRASSQIFGTTYGAWNESFHVKQPESLQAADDAVTQLYEALNRLGQADDTLVLFLSDNGFTFGEHRLFYGKGSAYEESIRIPFIATYPALIAGPRTEARMVLNIDLAPTFAELAGVPFTQADGASLVPLLRNQQTNWRDDFLIEYTDVIEGLPPTFTAVRTAQWKYVEYPTTQTAQSELYDLANDPAELSNLAADPSHSAIKATLQARLAALKQP